MSQTFDIAAAATAEIGRAACLADARKGASVVVASGRNADAIAAEIRAEGGNAIAIPVI